jgi:hypothetical protein
MPKQTHHWFHSQLLSFARCIGRARYASGLPDHFSKLAHPARQAPFANFGKARSISSLLVFQNRLSIWRPDEDLPLVMRRFQIGGAGGSGAFAVQLCPICGAAANQILTCPVRHPQPYSFVNVNGGSSGSMSLAGPHSLEIAASFVSFF